MKNKHKTLSEIWDILSAARGAALGSVAAAT